MILRPYQQAAVNAVYNYLRQHDDNPCVMLPTASGKTPVLATICRDAVQLWNGRVLIVAHVKELLEQAADKLQAIAPDLCFGVYSAGLGSRDTLAPVITAGIQSAYRRAHELGHFDLVIVDECFPAGTLVETPKGPIPIEKIRAGDLVFSATGTGEVLATSARAVRKLVKLEFSDGSTLACTPLHRIFTDRGWLEAGSVEFGTMVFSREDVRLLRKGLSTTGKDSAERSTTSHEGKPVEASAVLLEILLQEAEQSHDKLRCSSKDEDNNTGNASSANYAGWKRTIASAAAACLASRAWRRLDSRICRADHDAARARLADSLQSGPGKSRETDCNRDRWIEPCSDQSVRAGPQEDEPSRGKRVVRVTHHECASACVVHNLHVKEHPSYFADGVLAHNCHMIPSDGDGMYRTLIANLKKINPSIRIIGLTATPYRMQQGPICAPENILNTICYEIGVRELIVKGYLCPLISKAGKQKADFSSLHVRGGEYISSEVEQLMDDAPLIDSACKEILEYTRERRSVLIFASGVEHGEHIRQTIERLGAGCRCVFGDTLEFDRAQTLADFKSGKLKYLVNVNVLTTGFDAPNIDCIAMLRPTLSPGLWYQCCGRGFRLHPSKQNCLVLDFGGNVLRHGPIDAIQGDGRKSGGGEAPAKECPACHSVIAVAFMVCPDCGHAFPPRDKRKHGTSATDAGILTGQVTLKTYPVQEVTYSVHMKRGAPPDAPRTLRVDYRLSLNHWQSEWICIEHSGFARQKAEAWWLKRTSAPVPNTAEEACEIASNGALLTPTSITVKSVTGEDFDRIVGYEWPTNAESDSAQPEPDYVPADDSIPF